MKGKRAISMLLAVIMLTTLVVYAKPIDNKKSVQNNVAPQATFTVTSKKQVDLVILTSYTGQKLANLQTSVNNLKAKLLPLNYNVAVNYVTANKQYGTVMDRQFNYVRNVYYDADWQGRAFFHLTSDSQFIEPYHYRSSARVESTNAYESQYNTLPIRNPGTPNFTRGSVYYRTEGKYSYDRYNVDVTWTNDVLASKQFIVTFKTNNNETGVGNEMYEFPPHNEKITIDKSFVRSSLLAETPGNLNLLDVDQIKNITLNSNSERYLLVVDDGKGKDFMQTWGTYFASIGMDASVRDYIKNSSFKVKAVADTTNLDLYLDKRPIVSLDTDGDIVNFVTSDGKDLKMGGSYGTYYDYPVEFAHVEPAPTPPLNFVGLTVKEYTVSKTVGYYYVLDTNGILYHYRISDGYKTVMYSSGVRDLYYVGGNQKITFAVLSTGEIRWLSSSYKVLTGQSIKSIFTLDSISGQYFFFFTDTNDIYTFSIGYASSCSFVATGIKDARLSKSMLFCDMVDGTYKVMYVTATGYRTVSEDGEKTRYPIYGLIATQLTERVGVIKKEYSCDIPRVWDETNGIWQGGYKYFFAIDDSNRLYYNLYKFDDGHSSLPPDHYDATVAKLGTYSNVRSAYTNPTIAWHSPVVYLQTPEGNVVYMNNPAYPTWGLTQFTSNVKSMVSIEKVTEQTYGKLFMLLNDGTVRDETLANPIKQRVSIAITGKTYLSFREFLSAIPDNELYEIGAYQQAVDRMFLELQQTVGTTSNYVLVNEPVEYTTNYTDYENDPKQQQRWWFTQNSCYFDNPNGVDSDTGKYITTPINPFTKVGSYEITFQARDNPKNDDRFDTYRKWSQVLDRLTLYAHRKPIALQRITVENNGNGTFTIRTYDAGSYDLDHSLSRTDKGIVAREWRWREVTELSWHYQQMNKTDCMPDKSYILQLKVKDIDGAWSEWNTITIDKDNPPIALFTIDKLLIPTTELLKVKDQSFPQSFSSITIWQWIVKKYNSDGMLPSTNLQNTQYTNSNNGTGSMLGYDVNAKTNYSTSGPGKYKIYLRVKDSNGLWSDGGNDTTFNLNNFYNLDFIVDKPPTAGFIIEKSPIDAGEMLKLKDQSVSTGISPITRWNWIVKKLNADGNVPSTNIQNGTFTNSNNGTGTMAGHDVNVKTLYADTGTGKYRIYLRVANGNGMWSDGGTDGTINLGGFFYRDLEVQESFKISNFRVVKIRDFHLEPYYNVNDDYPDRPFYVNSMAIDPSNFIVGGISLVPGFSSLTKGYRFEFEIDSINFNEANDTIVITPTFFAYTTGVPGVRGSETDLYWEDSNKNIHKAGEGGHSIWATIKLDSSSRTTTGTNSATWRGDYFIPSTSWQVPLGTTAANAKSNKIKADIIVNFSIKGYKGGVMKYDYNIQQWPTERTSEKYPYEIGDVIRYDYTKSSLEDINIIINRP